MESRLRPELDELIKRGVQRRPYEAVDEFVLHEQEAWLAANQVGIRAKIAEGCASRGARRVVRTR